MLSFFRRKKPQDTPAVGKPPQFSAEELTSAVPLAPEPETPAAPFVETAPADAGAAVAAAAAQAPLAAEPPASAAPPPVETPAAAENDAGLIPANAAPAAAAGERRRSMKHSQDRQAETTCSTRSRPRC